jgi:hypothetical protein
MVFYPSRVSDLLYGYLLLSTHEVVFWILNLLASIESGIKIAP